MSDGDFDIEAAWLRRFAAEAQSNVGAFARRLKEAMPDRVTIHEKKGLFAASAKITGLSVELGDHRYLLDLTGGHLKASVSLVVRGIALNTRDLQPAEWFAQLAAETRQATEQARALSRSLAAFMAS